MKFYVLMLAALLLIIALGCNERKNQEVALSITDYKDEEKIYAADTTAATGSANEQQQQKPIVQTTSPTDWDKKIIKTATLNIETTNYNKYYSLIHQSVKRIGGYVAHEDQNQSEYKIENGVTIKVPVAQFEEAMGLLVNGTGNEKMIEKKIGSEDVTGQVVDTRSRLEAKRQVRLRYLDLLKQAKNMSEVLLVQKEINDLQEQIEMASGRMSFLNQSAAYSTIQLTFFQVLNPQAGTDTQPSFIIKLGNAFGNGWNFIQQLLLGLISIWPLLILFAGLWFGFRKWKLSKVKTG